MAPACRRPARYTLYGVLYHHGVSAGGGHYTLDVLHPNPRGGTSNTGVTGSGNGNSGETWLHIDDEKVSSVRHEDVFGHGNGNGKERKRRSLGLPTLSSTRCSRTDMATLVFVFS